jgi:hypothetical protein
LSGGSPHRADPALAGVRLLSFALFVALHCHIRSSSILPTMAPALA